jgi:hypothetical protein
MGGSLLMSRSSSYIAAMSATPPFSLAALRLGNAERLSIPEDADGSVKDLLIDVSSSWHDFQLPAEAPT